MAEADHTFLSDGLSSPSQVRTGVTNGIARPNGGGNFIYGFNSVVTNPGAVGLFTNLTDFAPMAKGGSVRAAVKRGAGGGNANFSPMLFIGLQGSSVNDQGYLLGLTDADPYHIALVKGKVVDGVPDDAPISSGVLLRSSQAFTISEDLWHHIRLDMVVNGTGDVILKVFENDLTANPVTAPIWAAVAGMSDFTDDALGVNSGSLPFTSGRGGYGFASKDVTRRGFFDHLELLRQL